MAIMYGTLYMMFAAFHIVYQRDRGWSSGIGGLAFIGIVVGMMIAAGYSIWDNKRYKNIESDHNGHAPPEPTIRHPDLSSSNIFISDSGDITGIIDWQHATILPIFLQAKIPKHFQNYSDDDSENFRPPKLAEEFATMSNSDKEIEMELYRRRQVHYFYLGYTSEINKAHFHAMGKYNLILRNQLYDVAGRP